MKMSFRKGYANKKQAQDRANKEGGSVVPAVSPARGFYVKLPDGSFLQDEVEVEDTHNPALSQKADDEYARSFSTVEEPK